MEIIITAAFTPQAPSNLKDVPTGLFKVRCSSGWRSGSWPIFKTFYLNAGSILHFSAITKIVSFDEEGICNTIWSSCATFAAPSDKDASATSSNASHQSDYPEQLNEEHSGAELPMDAGDVHRQTPSGAFQTTHEHKTDQTKEMGKW